MNEKNEQVINLQENPEEARKLVEAGMEVPGVLHFEGYGNVNIVMRPVQDVLDRNVLIGLYKKMFDLHTKYSEDSYYMEEMRELHHKFYQELSAYIDINNKPLTLGKPFDQGFSLPLLWTTYYNYVFKYLIRGE